MNPYVKRLMDERAQHVALIESIQKRAAEETRELNEDEKKTREERAERIKAIDGELEFESGFAQSNSKFTQLVGARYEAEEAATRAREKAASELTAEPRQDQRSRRSVGQEFVESDAFKTYKGRGSSGEVLIEGFLENRAAITTSTVDVPPFLYTQPGYQLTTPLLNAVDHVTVTSGSVEWFTWGGSNAQEVAEGALKPEASIDPTPHTSSLITYAHYKGITRQALEDIPQVQSIVEGKLRDGLGNALEAAAAEALTTNAQIPVVENEDLLAGIRQGIGEVQSHAYTPNAIILNPADYASLDIAAAAGAGNGPVGWGSFWGVPAIASGAIPAGTVYVGDFKQGETWFDRNSTAVYISDSHADFFVRNTLVILAEQRSVFAITEPLAIAKVTTPAVTPAVQTGA